MTKQVQFLLYGILFLLLLTALAMIFEKRSAVTVLPPDRKATVADQQSIEKSTKTEPQPENAQPQAPRSAASSQSQGRTAVSQAQIDLINKREEARQRRDEMLKVRAETIKRLGPGNTGEQQAEQ